ncbi:MAG: Hsp20/alpha crystallin family protein [Candidatus Dormiibacterota bacterium]
MSAMIPFRPFADIFAFDRRVGSVLDGSVWGGFPRVDVRDGGDHLEVIAEVPGVSPENIEVTVDRGVLTIAAQGSASTQTDRNGYVWRERRSTGLRRQFRLPEGASADGVEASLENGLLTVSVRKVAAPEPVKVAIKSGETSAALPEQTSETQPAAS